MATVNPFAFVRWYRKAASWSEVAAWSNDQAPLSPAVLEAAAALPVLPAVPPCSSLWPADLPQYFVADAGAAGRFLVDTQGSFYARYAVALPCARCGVVVDASGFCSAACAAEPAGLDDYAREVGREPATAEPVDEFCSACQQHRPCSCDEIVGGA